MVDFAPEYNGQAENKQQTISIDPYSKWWKYSKQMCEEKEKQKCFCLNLFNFFPNTK
jgi:hypothetical protein